jgi:hypothetical protein
VVLVGLEVGQVEQAAQAHQRQQPLAQRDHAQHVVRRVGHGGDAAGHLHDLLHRGDVDGVFLLAHGETHQAQFIGRHRGGVCGLQVVAPVSAALPSPSRLRTTCVELLLHQVLEVQHQHQLVLAVGLAAVDDAGQVVGLDDAADVVAGSISPGSMLTTLATRSTTKPSGWPMLMTRARVASSCVRSSVLNSRRRLTMGSTRPRRLLRPSSAGVPRAGGPPRARG